MLGSADEGEVQDMFHCALGEFQIGLKKKNKSYLKKKKQCWVIIQIIHRGCFSLVQTGVNLRG